MDDVNRNASSTTFGFQFQLNVAIYFMLHYLKEIDNIRVEGKKEDVEVVLTDKSKFMIQAKSQTKDLYDNSNNSAKLGKALQSLAAADDSKVKYLFYTSNMLNPLNSTPNEFDENSITIKKYNELSPNSKKKIDHQIEKNVKDNKNYDINKDKLVIMKIPFFGEFSEQRHKYIFEEAKEVFSLMSETLVNRHKTIINYYESKFLDNSATLDTSIKITKKEFCNWLILLDLDSMDLSNDNLNIGIEETDSYEAYQKYQNYIDQKINNYENYSKVYSLFNGITQKENISINEFVKRERIKLYNYFFSENLESDSDINENNKFDVYIAQIISYAILKKKSIISKIKKGANL